MTGRRGGLVAALIASCLLVSCTAGDDPQPDSVSETATDIDHAAVQEQGDAAHERSLICLEERGHSVTRYPNGEAEVAGQPGPAGEEQLLQDWAECEEQAGFPEARPLPAEDLSRMYDLALDRAECLRANGWEPAEPPSRQTYIEHYQLLQQQEGGSDMAPPYNPAQEYSAGEYNAILAACPEKSLADL